MTNSRCKLCQAERLTSRLYEDERVWIARCKSHPDKWLVVLKRHGGKPTEEERAYMLETAGKLLTRRYWREPRTILDHFHLHEV